MAAPQVAWITMAEKDDRTGVSSTLENRVEQFTSTIAETVSGHSSSIASRAGVYGSIATLSLAAISTSALAQSEHCSSGIGALVMELQGMVLAVALGVIVLGAAAGMALRMFTPFPGATSVGGVMLLAALGGPIMFVLVITFIEMIFSTIGIGAGQACSPFL